MCAMYAWVNVFRIIPEFKILNLWSTVSGSVSREFDLRSNGC